jgi:hypothetical protein
MSIALAFAAAAASRSSYARKTRRVADLFIIDEPATPRVVELLQDVNLAPVIHDLPPNIRRVRLNKKLMLPKARVSGVQHLPDYSLGSK